MEDYYERMKGYYERRAAEYDDAYLGRGVYSDRGRNPEELEALQRAISDLPLCRVLDVGCGTGFITRHLRGEVVGLDQSEAMLEVARERVHDAAFVRGEALVCRSAISPLTGYSAPTFTGCCTSRSKERWSERSRG